MLRSKVLKYLLMISSLFSKEIIAVLDLDQIGLSDQKAQILTQRLTTKLISLDKYQVVERNNMDKILKEQKFQHSGCTDSECAVEIGQLLNSDFIVMGSVNKFGNTYAIDSRLIDVGLGKGVISAEFSMTGEIDALLTTGITSIAKQLCEMQASTTLLQSPDQFSKSPISAAIGATLDIKSNPLGANIFIDGNYFDTTPLILKDFPAGDYDVELRLKGYRNFTKRIKLLPKGYQTINSNLVIKHSYIQLNGTPTIQNVRIEIDGKNRIVKSKEGYIGVTEGIHYIKISKNNYLDHLDTIMVKTGEIIEVKYDLQRN